MTTDKYGPNTEAVQQILDQIRDATPEQIEALRTARDAARDAAWYAAWYAARDAAWAAAWYAARDAAWDAAWDAVVWDLASPEGPFTIEHRDLLIAPYKSVFGLHPALIPAKDNIPIAPDGTVAVLTDPPADDIVWVSLTRSDVEFLKMTVSGTPTWKRVVAALQDALARNPKRGES